MYYFGIDHHKKYSQVAVMDEQGKLHVNCQIANRKATFQSLKERFNAESCSAAIEASRSWGKIYDLLEDIGIDTTVAHPLKTRAIAEARIKTDSIDAATLAHLLRADLIPEVCVPTKEIREQKNLLRHRLWLVKLQTMTKNRIYDLVDRNHLEIEVKKLFTTTGREFLNNLKLPDIDTKLLKDHLKLLDEFKPHIKQTEVWIDDVLKDNPLVSILDSLPGFAKILSALAALEINNINRFINESKFASYCCLIPSTYASGSKVYHGDLISTGNRYLKYVFIEAAWSSIRISVYCKQYFNRIKERKGSNVAILALARRLSEIAYKCLKENRLYEERPYLPYSR